MLGNIKFIGELFKKKMLPIKVMHECIQRLLGDITNPAIEDIECLCKLMTTVGKLIDTKEAAQYIEQYFHRMEELSTNKKLPSRIRFMLQDVIDLRRNMWIPRRPEDTKKEDKDEQKKTVTDKEFTIVTRPHKNTSSAVRKHDKKDEEDIKPVTVFKKENLSSAVVGLSASEITLAPKKIMKDGARGWNQGSNTKSNIKDTVLVKESSTPATTFDVPKMSKEIGGLTEEYISGGDLQEAVQTIKDLNIPKDLYANIVSEILKKLTSIDQKSHSKIRKLLTDLNGNPLTPENFIQGIHLVFQELDDISTDSPNAPKFLGIIVGELVALKIMPLNCLDNCFEYQELVTLGKAELFIIEVLSSLKSFNAGEAASIFMKSRIDILKYLKPSNKSDAYLTELLAKKDLTVFGNY